MGRNRLDDGSVTTWRPCSGCGKLTTRDRCMTCRPSEDSESESALAREIRERDGGRCYVCGGAEGKMEARYIYPEPVGGSVAIYVHCPPSPCSAATSGPV